MFPQLNAIYFHLLFFLYLQLISAGLSRHNHCLEVLVQSLTINKRGLSLVLESTNQYLRSSASRISCESVDELMHAKAKNGDSLQQVLLAGLVELCKVKPSGEVAISSLGKWLIENNPNKPKVVEQ